MTPPRKPDSLGDRAADDLRFIREAMARSTTFSAVPGAGGVLMGVIGSAAAATAALQPSPNRWLLVWVVAAIAAAGVGVSAIVIKAARAGLALTGATPQRFALGLAAPIAAGAAITYALWTAGTYTAMPAVWLLLYGAGVLAGGVFTVPVVRLTGALFMLLGFVAVVTPPSLGNVWLGVAFGALHISSGIIIMRRHGG